MATDINNAIYPPERRRYEKEGSKEIADKETDHHAHEEHMYAEAGCATGARIAPTRSKSSITRPAFLRLDLAIEKTEICTVTGGGTNYFVGNSDLDVYRTH